VECPICGGFDEKDRFTCPKCGRENICGAHYNFDYLICEDCARDMAPAQKKPSAKAVKVAESVEVEEVPAGPVKNPFYTRKVKCAVCGVTSEQRWFQAKIYSERNIDIDKHVQSYLWTDKAFEAYNPSLYYIWHCPNCHFAESYVDFENPGKDPFSNFRSIKDEFVNQYHEDPRVEKIIDKLGENIDYNKINYYIAIKLHLLALFIQLLPAEKENWDPLKVGRYYLRLGWLYREFGELKEPDDKIKNTLGKLIEFLKKGWPEVPGDEKTALKQAIVMMNEAFKSSQAIKSIVAEVDLLMLIAGIHLKLEETEVVLKILNTVLQRGQKTKQRIENNIRDSEKAEKPLPPEEIKRLDVQVKKIEAMMNKARDLITDIKSKRYKEERAKAQEIIKTLGERPPIEIREILLKKGIDQRVATELTPEPKKKFLGLF